MVFFQYYFYRLYFETENLYISKLHQELDRLWQRPLGSFIDIITVWYSRVLVGSKTLTMFMSDLRRKCDLDQIYTNHSVRGTEATMLSKGMYGPSQIMAVTGHKSVQSLTVYQRVNEEEKLKMGQSISEAMLPSASKQFALPALTIMALSSTGGTQLALPTSQPSTEPVVVPVPQTADATKYLECICLN